MKYTLTIFLFLLFLRSGFAQHTEMDHPYTWPADPQVREKLEAWQDLKFGIFMHWGTYSQWGIVESWSLCPEDEDWTQRRGPSAQNYFEYKKAYEGLQKTFNPTDFNPEKWAQAAKTAGFKYVIFTFKHHDGFCMFDTKQTDYKITDVQTPFHTNPRANVAKEICNAFQKENFWVGAYFSKPDWHSQDYWWSYFPPKNRNVNYDPEKYPERWKSFRNFTYNQISEILSDYGNVDILWLDGAWVQQNTKAPLPGTYGNFYNQDIDMAGIAAMGRSKQPGLLVVDRALATEYENYRTPEQQIPDKPYEYPWETCMTLATSWSYVPNDVYKPAWKIIHNLVDIVAKGGNYLLNVGPSPQGDWHPEAYQRMAEIGEWMKVNGDAIYATRPMAPYKEGNICFTQNKNGAVNAIYLAAEDETMLPKTIVLNGITPEAKAKITLLGAKGALKWKTGKGVTTITIPEKLRKNPPCRHAWTFRIEN